MTIKSGEITFGFLYPDGYIKTIVHEGKKENAEPGMSYIFTKLQRGDIHLNMVGVHFL